MVKKGVHISGAKVLVVQVVRVLPDIAGQQRDVVGLRHGGISSNGLRDLYMHERRRKHVNKTDVKLTRQKKLRSHGRYL